MDKISDVCDLFDKSFDFYNLFIDLNNYNITNEINWLNKNYNNINELKNYFLGFVNLNNFTYYIQYVNYLNSLSDENIQFIAQQRANVLYANIKHNKQQKIENKPLKLIVNELKKSNL